MLNARRPDRFLKRPFLRTCANDVLRYGNSFCEARNQTWRSAFIPMITEDPAMNSIIYLVGLVVVVMFILSVVGIH